MHGIAHAPRRAGARGCAAPSWSASSPWGRRQPCCLLGSNLILTTSHRMRDSPKWICPFAIGWQCNQIYRFQRISALECRIEACDWWKRGIFGLSTHTALIGGKCGSFLSSRKIYAARSATASATTHGTRCYFSTSQRQHEQQWHGFNDGSGAGSSRHATLGASRGRVFRCKFSWRTG